MSSLIIKDTVFTLPSQGVLYEDLELVGDDSVRLRPFHASDQKVLAGQAGDQYKIFRNLLTKVVVEPEKLDIDKLLVSDANAMLYAVRIMTYGPQYTFQYKCDNCGAQNNVNSSLEELQVIEAQDVDGFSFTNEIKLSNGDVITFHLPTLRDEKITSNTINAMKRRNKSIGNMDLERTFVRTAVLIDKINDEESISHEKTLGYINELPIQDFNDLIDEISARDIGISTLMDVECSNCSWYEEIRMGITAEFFRPKRTRS